MVCGGELLLWQMGNALVRPMAFLALVRPMVFLALVRLMAFLPLRISPELKIGPKDPKNSNIIFFKS